MLFVSILKSIHCEREAVRVAGCIRHCNASLLVQKKATRSQDGGLAGGERPLRAGTWPRISTANQVNVFFFLKLVNASKRDNAAIMR